MSAGGMGGQAQPMGGGKGGMGMTQGPASGGKGGMDQNLRGPAGNAQNNPGGPRAFGPGPFNPFDRRSQMNVLPGHTTGGMWGGRPAPISNDSGYGGFGGGLDTSGMTPISANFTPPTPQPQSPVGGYIGGQPAQFHYQAQALNKPQPQTTASGLPAGGLLARLYGG